MIEINLLPKEYLKGSHGLSLSKAGKYVAASVGGLILILVGITFYQIHKLGQLEENIEKANRRATMLRQDIRVVDALMDVKSKITNRMTTVDKLDRNRSAWVRILEDLGRNVPEFVWLGHFSEKEEAIAKKGDTTAAAKASSSLTSVRPVEVEGYAFTLNALAAFMIKVMRSDYFDAVELVSATEVTFNESGVPSRSTERTQKGDKAYNFVLSCNVHYLTDEELRNLAASSEGQDQSQGTSASHKQLN